MRASVVWVLAVSGLWSNGAAADTVLGDGAVQVRAPDAGAEHVLSTLRGTPRLWREGVRAGEPRSSLQGDVVLSEAPLRAFEIVTTRRLGSPAWTIRDRSSMSVLWEAEVRFRGGRSWGLEFTSIREADVFDRTSVGSWPF